MIELIPSEIKTPQMASGIITDGIKSGIESYITIEEKMANHPLHKTVGKLMDRVFSDKDRVTIIKDPACETTKSDLQNVPLFCSEEKSNRTELCNVDILMLYDKSIKVIIEIEEANIKPTQICGKYLTSALSNFFIHKSWGKIPMGESVLFVQILDNSKLKENSSKPEQWKNIEKEIGNILPVNDSPIKKYKIIGGNVDSFKINGKSGEELVSIISAFL